tara:strand:- start:16342 stop:16806 length:465 start_codon:yes stop_codon:yes gene_type:complete
MIDKIALFALLIMTLIYICSEKSKYERTKEDFVNVRKSESPNINRTVKSRFMILPSTSNKENFKNPSCDPIKRRRDRLKRELAASERMKKIIYNNYQNCLTQYDSMSNSWRQQKRKVEHLQRVRSLQEKKIENLTKKVKDLKAHHNFLANRVED